ncbi:MAG: type II toxin-antitoxin system RelE/ParE family toxin [bacterium]
MKVIWSKESLDRLIEIEEFISEYNPIKAVEFIDFIISKSITIEDNPKIGRVVPELSNNEIRELIIKNYRLVYKIRKNNIEILTVFEGHRLIKRSEIFP